MIKIVAAAAVMTLCLSTAGESVNAEYHFVQTGASEAGTVSIEEKPKGNPINGYSLPGNYQVSYSISKDSWNCFDDRYGGFFLMGDQLNVSGGCQFAYHTSGGAIWDDGAIKLGGLSDAKQIMRCDVEGGAVSCSFEVGSLSELPNYIAYAYVPASSAYVHITEEYGTNSHIWHYKSLKDVQVKKRDGIDSTPPVTSVLVVPTGKSVNVNGKIWSEAASIQLRAEDKESRPGGICLYQNGGIVLQTKNIANQTVLESNYNVEENGSYEADAYDQLNNRSPKSKLNVSCIDKEAPVIKSVQLADKGFVKETKIIVNANDNGCGLNKEAYSVNGGAWESSPELRVCANGVYQVKVRDALGNESSQSITVSNIDREAPEISFRIIPGGTMTTYQGILWSTEAVLSVSASDEKSGMKEICILDQTGNILEEKLGNREIPEMTLSLEKRKIKNGSYKIKALDRLDQEAETEEIKLMHVDDQPPVINAVRQIPQDDGSLCVVVEAADKVGGIGLDEKAYSFDGGKTWQKETEWLCNKNDIYELVVRDRLGQSASVKVKITNVTEKKEEDSRKPDKPDDTVKQPIPDNTENMNSAGNIDDLDKGSYIDSKNEKHNEDGKRITERDNSRSKTVSENRLYEVSRKQVAMDKALSDADEKVVHQLDGTGIERKDTKLPKAILAVLAGLFVAGLLGLLLYLFLYYRRYSCVFYGIDEKRDRKRLCRLFIKEKEDDWQVEVPEHKLGTLGTGKYVFVFHPSFVKEEAPTFVIILIDGKAVKEKLSEEIEVTI